MELLHLSDGALVQVLRHLPPLFNEMCCKVTHAGHASHLCCSLCNMHLTQCPCPAEIEGTGDCAASAAVVAGASRMTLAAQMGSGSSRVDR